MKKMTFMCGGVGVEVDAFEVITIMDEKINEFVKGSSEEKKKFNVAALALIYEGIKIGVRHERKQLSDLMRTAELVIMEPEGTA